MIGRYGLSVHHPDRDRRGKRITSGKIGTGERLVDDESRHRIRVVRVREFSSTQHGNTKRAEISGRDHPHDGATAVRRGTFWRAQLVKARATARTADHRKADPRSCRLDARQRAQRAPRPRDRTRGDRSAVYRAGETATLIVSTSWASNPMWRAIQRDERANEDAGAAEQHDRHGDLHDDERLSHTGRVTALRAARPQRVGHRSPREQDRRCEAGDRACRERQAERVRSGRVDR